MYVCEGKGACVRVRVCGYVCEGEGVCMYVCEGECV